MPSLASIGKLVLWHTFRPTLNAPAINLQPRRPEPGQVARVRTRTYLVESVHPSPGTGTLVRMACLDDDAQGQPLEIVWELELDPEILDREAWQSIGKRGFDDTRHFSAFIHTLRWNCVTATDTRIFQAPFRAGIRLDAYQLEPLRKALLLPRVNLFIADDVGLGKTIEAALIASELLLRRRVREILVACPPSMLGQWKDELEVRFGLMFEILDRAYLERIRQERGNDEAESIRRVLEDQKRRVLTELGRYDQTQLLLSVDLEKRQLESNRRYWDKWLANVEGDLQREPDRVRQFYQVASFRVEPVGLAYMSPVSG